MTFCQFFKQESGYPLNQLSWHLKLTLSPTTSPEGLVMISFDCYKVPRGKQFFFFIVPFISDLEAKPCIAGKLLKDQWWGRACSARDQVSASYRQSWYSSLLSHLPSSRAVFFFFKLLLNKYLFKRYSYILDIKKWNSMELKWLAWGGL